MSQVDGKEGQKEMDTHVHGRDQCIQGGDTVGKETSGEMENEVMYVDSGATDTVCPKSFAPSQETKATKESIAGKYYKAANDSKIGVLGRKVVEGITDDWNPITLNAEVAEVKRCLGSVKRMCEAGNVVHFDTDTRYIQMWHQGERHT